MSGWYLAAISPSLTALHHPSPPIADPLRVPECLGLAGLTALGFRRRPRFPRANWPCKCWEKMPGRNGPVLTNRYKVVPHG